GPGGKVLTAVTDSGEVTTWDVGARKAGAARRLPGGRVIGLSDDGSVAVTASGRKVTVVETATGRRRATLQTAGPPPGAAEEFERQAPGEKFNPAIYDADIAVLARDKRTLAVRCWNLEVWSLGGAAPKRVATLTQTSGFHGFRFSPDGRRLA